MKSDNPVSVILPEGASLVDMSDVPLEVEGNKITLPAGEIEVSFTLEEGTDTPNLAKEKSAPTKIILSLGALLLISILGFALWKR